MIESSISGGITKTYTSNTKYPSLYANQKGAGPNVTAANASTISQPDITKGNDPYEESKSIVPEGTTEPTTSSTSASGSPLTVTQTFYYIAINNENYGTAYSVLANSRYFWVSARCVVASSGCARFNLCYAHTYTIGCSMFDSDCDTYSDSYALRPVVSLPSSLLTGEKDSNGAWNLNEG